MDFFCLLEIVSAGFFVFALEKNMSHPLTINYAKKGQMEVY